MPNWACFRPTASTLEMLWQSDHDVRNALFHFCQLWAVKEVLHLLPQKAPKLACFVLYLKIINIFLKNDIYILK